MVKTSRIVVELAYCCHDILFLISVSACACAGKKRLSSATRRPNSASRPETGRSGIIAARHQRVLSAKKARQQAADDDDQQRRPSSAAAVQRPMSAASRPRTAAVRPRSSTTLASSSMDSVTYESERRRTAQRPATSSSSPTRTVTSPASTSNTVLTTNT